MTMTDKQDSAGYSEQYKAIQEKAETEWPRWKVDLYNSSVAISAHAKKIEKR